MTDSTFKYSSQDLCIINIAPIHDEIEQGLLILTPNHRTSVQLLEAYGIYRKQHNYPEICRSPQIFPVDIWLRQHWEDLANRACSKAKPRLILEPFQELFLWKSIIKSSPIGSTLLSLEGTANTVQEAYRSLQQWKISLAELEDEETSHDDIAIFLDWLKEYDKRSQQNSHINLSQLLQEFIATLDEGLVNLPKTIKLFGFDTPPPLYQKLFDSLQTNFTKVNTLEFNTFSPQLEKVAFSNQAQEMIAAAQWAKQTLKEHPSAKIAVICPDLHGRNLELQRAFSHAFYPDNILLKPADKNTLFSSAASEKLSAISPIATALLLLKLNQKSMETLEVCQILRSPFILAQSSEASPRAALEYRLRKNSETTIALSQLRSLSAQQDKSWYCPELATALIEIENVRQQHKSQHPLKQWVTIIEQQLDLIGWSIPEHEQTVHQLWQGLLTNFIKLDYLSLPQSFSKAINTLKQLAHTSKASVFFNQAPVQILSPVEAAGLQFSHLWFMGLSEANWPPSTRSNPFIPLKVQRAHNLPASSAELQYLSAKETLQQFINNTRDSVVFSYPQQSDDISVKPSLLLKAFDSTTEPSLKSVTESTLHPYSQNLFAAKSELETVSEDLQLSLQPDEVISGGTALIADQANCAFSSFAKHRLKAKELPKLQYGLPAFAVGNMLHQAMELLWQDLKDQDSLTKLTQEQLQVLVKNASSQALIKIVRQYPNTMTEAYRALEVERLSELLLDWLEEERKRGSFRIAEHEYALQWQHANLKLEFRIDRIEEFPDGSFGLVDYKTSKNNNTVNWLDERQDKPQLLLYLQAAENDPKFQNISSLLYAQVNIEEMKYKGISQSADTYPGVALEKQRNLPKDIAWQDLKDHWASSLQNLAQEFLDGYLAVNPKSQTSCQYCHLADLCRIQEQRRQA